ncbi:hypothetical protein CO611_09130 [Lysobacteraceae bacterium NML03-0222]|nr:hypothetical protein CO611_09130 [Xanthomonadaceae bacterium NML03-0222]
MPGRPPSPSKAETSPSHARASSPSRPLMCRLKAGKAGQWEFHYCLTKPPRPRKRLHSQYSAMIISPPFLSANNAINNQIGHQATEGTYPIGQKLAWHGGMHLAAPITDNNASQVRAIADGIVVYKRNPTPRSEGHALAYKGWTDDGCVIIRHDTSIGANNEDETQVRFFSIYLHLDDILPAVQQGQAINRKAPIGRAGMIEGHANLIHFEIICDDTNLEKLIGRSRGELNINVNGRSDTVFGEMYIRLPVGTQVFPQRPALNQATGQNGTATTEELFVGLHYNRGNLDIKTYRANGTVAGTMPPVANGEYDLYREAGQIVEAYRRAQVPIVPVHSAVFELLRFGRVLGPDALTPADTPHWRKINTGTTTGWVNLNADNVHVFSDADAPHWAGWHLLNDFADDDSRCDLALIRNLLDEDKNSITSRAEAERRIRNPSIQTYLRGLVCKFPTEWHKGHIAKRWGWLKREGPAGAPTAKPSLSSNTYLSERDFPEFERYAQALGFWEEANIGIPEVHWHFHPLKFIEHFSKCGWLSKEELKQIYTRTAHEVRERYRLDLNRTTRKYLYINSMVRLSHFLGQGAIESTQLNSMQEDSMLGRRNGNNFFGTRIDPASRKNEQVLGHWFGSEPGEDNGWFSSTKHNSRGVRIASSYNWRNGNLGDPDAIKYRGRGFKQLTGLLNYSKYWVYRGWLEPSSFDDQWWLDPQYQARNANRMRRRPPTINDPQRVTATPFNCMDTGGWYLLGERPSTIREIDSDLNRVASSTTERSTEQALSYRVTYAINGGYIQKDDRLRATREAKAMLL